MFESSSKSRKSWNGRQMVWQSVLWIFAISSIYMFSRSGNHLLTGLLSYNAWGALENSKQLPVMKVFEVTHGKYVAHVQRVVREVAQTWQLSRNASNE